MALTNTGHVIDLIQMYAGMAGVNRENVNETLIVDLINLKLKEFVRRTGASQSKTSITTADEDGDGVIDREYELPTDLYRALKVNLDSHETHKITFEEVDRMLGKVS